MQLHLNVLAIEMACTRNNHVHFFYMENSSSHTHVPYPLSYSLGTIFKFIALYSFQKWCSQANTQCKFILIC